MSFEEENRKASEPYAAFDGHALFLVRVPHGVAIQTNGIVIAECAPRVAQGYVDMLVDRAFRGHRLAASKSYSNR